MKCHPFRNQQPIGYFIVIVLVGLIILTGCEESGHLVDNFSIEIALEGAVQKGPFLNGTAVQVTELEADLSPTGRTFSSQIENNAGLFTLPSITYSSQYVEIQANGYYYNELTDSPSGSPITLYAISDITSRTTVNVNLLSTLERPRVKYLLGEGYDYETAKDSALQEVFDIFSITPSGSSSSEDLSIISAGEDNTGLLAISLILQAGRTEAELSELVSNISFDLREDGELTSSSSITSLYRGVNQVEDEKIRTNLESRYEDLGLNTEIGDFEALLDSYRNQQDSLVVRVEKDIDCSGQGGSGLTAIIEGGHPPYQWTWSSSDESGLTLEDVSEGTHALSVADSYGQTVLIEDIIIPTVLDVEVDITHIDSDNPMGSIDLSIIGGEGPFDIIWSNGHDTDVLEGAVVGEYGVSIIDANGCSVDTTVSIIDMQNILDIDGNSYNAVQIGKQIWMVENLRVTKYRNGDPIQNLGIDAWDTVTHGTQGVYENNAENIDAFGLLYNWFAVSDSRNIAPDGWHIPTSQEYEELYGYAGWDSRPLKSSDFTLWNEQYYCGTNETGFSAVPGGILEHGDYNTNSPAEYRHLGDCGYYWTTTLHEEEPELVYLFDLEGWDINAFIAPWENTKYSASVRCVKD